MGFNEINEQLKNTVNDIYSFVQENNITKEDIPMMEAISEIAREQEATPMQELGLTLATTAVLKNEELCDALFQVFSKRLLSKIGGIINGTTQ